MIVRAALSCILFSLLLLTHCGVAKKTNSPDAVCRSVPFSVGEPVVGWQKVSPPDPSSVGTIILPKRFGSYHIPGDELERFFIYAKQKGVKSGFSIPLPAPLGCQYFEVENSGTLSEGLAAKFPELASLKGTAIHNRNATIRLDFDGAKMHAEIIWENGVYVVKPVDAKSGVVYVVYHKNDSGEEKQPFEKTIDPALTRPPAQYNMQVQPSADR